MKSSLLGNFEDIESSMDPIKEIEQFINTNYKTTGHLHISKEPDKNGKYVVNCNKSVCTTVASSKHITSLTNGMFKWGEVNGDFDCSYCKSLTSLEGAPKKIDGCFDCCECNSLKTLEGAPRLVNEDFSCDHCESLTSLEGAPKEVGGYFNCCDCNSLTSLEGCPKEVGGSFNCFDCKSLILTADIPKNIHEKIIRYYSDNVLF